MDAEEEILDRRERAIAQPPKPARWPRTERRQRRVEAVLRRRQPDLTVVLENVHDPHNVSAVLRSCDAVGVLGINVVYSIESPPERAYARTTSASAAKWVDVTRYKSVDACYSALRRRDFKIYAATLGDSSQDLYDLNFTRPTAVVFGNEMRGLSAEAVALADAAVAIPMMGMVQSLNISVACAVTLYEALRQRRAARCYDVPTLDEQRRAEMMEEWLRR